MKFSAKVFVWLCLIIGLSLTLQVYAQNREGIGALLSSSSGSLEVIVKNVKTAPNAEIFVETGEGAILATGKLLGSGEVSFRSNVDPKDSNNLYIYIVDSIGSNRKIPISNLVIENTLLPPTITYLGSEFQEHIRLGGYSFPGSVITVYLSSDERQIGTYQAQADSTIGRWELELPSLEDSIYTARATSKLNELVSLESDPFAFQFQGNVIRVVSLAAQVLLIPSAVSTLAPLALSLEGLSYVLLRLLLALRGLLSFGRRKKRRFGIIYDALTRQPVVGAIVRLFKDTGELVETEVTGLGGIFTFLPLPGSYKVKVIKPGYQFPSSRVKGALDGEYNKPYHGETINIESYDTTINISIPIDPLYVPTTATRRYRFKIWYSKYGIYAELCLFFIGVVISVISVIFQKGLINNLILFYYLIALSASVYKAVVRRRAWGIVIDSDNRPVAYISLALFDGTFHRLVQRRLSDMVGRYQFVLPKGRYSLQVTSEGWEIFPRSGCYNGGEIVVSRDNYLLSQTIMVKKKG